MFFQEQAHDDVRITDIIINVSNSRTCVLHVCVGVGELEGASCWRNDK